MGFTDSDHRQPGWNVARPTIVPPTLAISSLPFGNSRVSSLPTALLPPAIVIPLRLETQRLTADAERCSGRADDIQRAADEHQVVGRCHGHGPGTGLGHGVRDFRVDA